MSPILEYQNTLQFFDFSTGNLLPLLHFNQMSTKSNILILDDSPELLDALKIFLENHSYTVCAVTSGDLLASELKRFTPDLFILDVFIGFNTDGRSICKMIKSNEATSLIPVILISASKSGLKDFEECSADAILEKPFNLSELLLLVRKFLLKKKEEVYNEKKTELIFPAFIPMIFNW